MSTTERVLLPKNVKPQHYAIHLKPNLTTFKFTGTEAVTLQISEETNFIIFNALEITVQSASISINGIPNSTQSPKNIFSDPGREVISLEFSTPLPKNVTVVLLLQFEGEINDKLVGFYRSKYEMNGTSYWLGTTQFEPCDARRAFPCWDEPALKATFSITITGPKDLTYLSNMPSQSETITGDTKTVVFHETPVMSTYLVAYCLGHFEHVEATTQKGITFRVWTIPGKKELGRFALGVGAKVLDYFTDYYGIPYPLPKQDMIAVPDFSFGAMENWGLITYRETALLCDEATSGYNAKARVAYVVAHELAHQWFGNLVTMEWWKQLWLNEGFATFMGTKAVDHLFPQWSVWTKFLSDHIFRALKADSLRNSHPIEVDISVARKVDEIFDAISYAKGASVILMIEAAIGPEGFQKGLNIYLQRFKYGNAVSEDLWQCLSEGSHKNVAAIMDTWVKKIGFPIVTVEETNEIGKFKVTQNRYLAAGDVKPEENETIWPLLIGVTTKSDRKTKFSEVNTRSAIVTVNVQSANEWVKFNAGQSGLFRVRYSKHLLQLLGSDLLSLSPEDRAGIQSDAFALVTSGDLPLVDYLQLLLNYESETNDTVWTDLFSNLSILRRIFAESPASEKLNKFILKVSNKIGKELGWVGPPGEDETRQSLRGAVLGILGGCEDAATIEEAKKIWAGFLADRNSLSADLQSCVFYLAVRTGGEEEFNKMIEVYKTATLPAQKTTALRCIGLTKKEELIKKGLAYMMSDEVRMQDRFILLSSLSSTPLGRQICWHFVQSDWAAIVDKFSHNLLPRVINFCENFTSLEKAKEIEHFFEKHKVDGTERTIAQTLESIQSNVSLLSRNEKDVIQYLQNLTY